MNYVVIIGIYIIFWIISRIVLDIFFYKMDGVGIFDNPGLDESSRAALAPVLGEIAILIILVFNILELIKPFKYIFIYFGRVYLKIRRRIFGKS